MKKILCVFTLLFVGVWAFASEQNGVVMGFHIARATAKSEFEASNITTQAPSHRAYRYGLMLGYEEFASPELGVRYYGVFDFGSKYKNDEKSDEKGGYQIFTYNFNFNIDVIRDYVMQSGMRYGFFVGLSGGYADNRVQFADDAELTVSGLDFGFNTGVRIGYKAINTEIFGRFSVMEQESKGTHTLGGQPYEFRVKQPYSVGLRITYTF